MYETVLTTVQKPNEEVKQVGAIILVKTGTRVTLAAAVCGCISSVMDQLDAKEKVF